MARVRLRPGRAPRPGPEGDPSWTARTRPSAQRCGPSALETRPHCPPCWPIIRLSPTRTSTTAAHRCWSSPTGRAISPTARRSSRLLIEAGADPNALTHGGDQPETPLHWAASSDDADVAAALINAGADLEQPRRVDRHPARQRDRVRMLERRPAPGPARRPGRQALARRRPSGHVPGGGTARHRPPIPDNITEAFWQACHGGQRRTAERLLASGADTSQTPGYSDQTALQAAHEHGTQRDNLITWLQDRQQAG